MAAKPLSLKEFTDIMESSGCARAVSPGTGRLAVGVSGGPDSMALAWLLARWAQAQEGFELHALSVDHGLRVESAQEIQNAGVQIKGWPGVTHAVLPWSGRKPKSRIQEAAREARYRLMADYCRAHDLHHVFLAHHQEDQAETVLFRLAKGSGLDGLAAMRAQQGYGEALTLLRPLLAVPKDRLLATCVHNQISFACDPSNESDEHARPRLRKSMAVLQEEGLSIKRLAVTAARLERARVALDEIAEKVYKQALLEKKPNRIVFKCEAIHEWPSEIGLRILLKAIENLRPDKVYSPRMEKVEDLFSDLLRAPAFRKRTLGGLVFVRDDRRQWVVISAETAKNKES